VNDIESFFSATLVCCVPQVQVPADVDFGAVCGTDTQTRELEVCNTGKEDLVVNSITSDDAQFGVTAPSSGYPVTISPDFCFPFEATFSPDGSGDASATLTIDSNDPVNPSLETQVEGTVPPPDINVAIANSGDFGAVCAGDQVDLDLTLFNQGMCDLTISSISIDQDNGSFLLPDDLQTPLVLSPDADFIVPIRYAPAVCNDLAEGATIEIESDSPGESPLEIAISGTSPCPDLVIDPEGLTGLNAFPATVVDANGNLGCFTDREVTLRNRGDCPLTIDDISAAGADFTVIGPTDFPLLLPGGEETLEATVRFTPQADGNPLAPSEVTGTLTVVSDDPDGNVLADLCGESVAQSGVRILVTDVSSGSPEPVGEVDSIDIMSKGKNQPGPINLKFTDQPLSNASVCENSIDYHVDQETLPEASSDGNNKSSYEAKAKEGNLQASEGFNLDQCELREFQLQIRDSDSDVCLLLPKGASCETDGECCSGNCKGPDGGKTCK
jgi:hypothetical protein